MLFPPIKMLAVAGQISRKPFGVTFTIKKYTIIIFLLLKFLFISYFVFQRSWIEEGDWDLSASRSGILM